ncbi:YtxH domain-containing protein [Lysinibacillus sp. NPDC086135]|uniref:YtxH domain-containing protein n=1 Tax=Lysinibacillus sp. NPDC086135 TaxID=3364130 RepID=UPI00381B3171
MTKGAITFFYPQKAKDTKQKLKEKVYFMKRKIKKFTYEVKEKFYRNSKINRSGNYVSIIVGFLLLIMSWSVQIEWLIWLSTISIFSNIFLLTIQKYSTLSKGA